MAEAIDDILFRRMITFVNWCTFVVSFGTFAWEISLMKVFCGHLDKESTIELQKLVQEEEEVIIWIQTESQVGPTCGSTHERVSQQVKLKIPASLPLWSGGGRQSGRWNSILWLRIRPESIRFTVRFSPSRSRSIPNSSLNIDRFAECMQYH